MSSANTGSTDNIRFAVLAADTVLLTFQNDKLFVRLVSVNRPPHFPEGSKGLPGGLLFPDEVAEQSAARHIQTKGGINPDKVYLEQLYTFSEVDRDPRGRVVAVAYLAVVPWDRLDPIEKQNNNDAWWSEVSKTGNLAYDHNKILDMALTRLRHRISYSTIVCKLLPNEFSLTELQDIFSVVLSKKLDKRNFRKKILKLDILKPLSHKQDSRPYRPARLYTYKSSDVEEIDII
ncbi:MAG: NUDIX domain-containing protein [Patescibacteria group bacterium]|jgi:8-oxo-dGTP diphosphatase